MINHKIADRPTKFRASGCFCIYEDSLLVIQRQRRKSFGMHWAIPTGKIEVGESPRECMVRELGEELGLEVEPDRLEMLSDFIVDDKGTVFEYVAFALVLDTLPELVLKPDEVRQATWVKVGRVLKRRVVPYFYNTLHDFLDWRDNNQIQWRLLPEPEAKSAKRHSAGSAGNSRVRGASAVPSRSRRLPAGTGTDLFR